jgi:hypothetical protein
LTFADFEEITAFVLKFCRNKGSSLHRNMAQPNSKLIFWQVLKPEVQNLPACAYGVGGNFWFLKKFPTLLVGEIFFHTGKFLILATDSAPLLETWNSKFAEECKSQVYYFFLIIHGEVLSQQTNSKNNLTKTLLSHKRAFRNSVNKDAIKFDNC